MHRFVTAGCASFLLISLAMLQTASATDRHPPKKDHHPPHTDRHHPPKKDHHPPHTDHHHPPQRDHHHPPHTDRHHPPQRDHHHPPHTDRHAPRSVCDVITFKGGECPKPTPCVKDASTCVLIDNARPALTPQGVHAFMAMFQAAAEKGVENATIRALNGGKVAPACTDCDKK